MDREFDSTCMQPVTTSERNEGSQPPEELNVHRTIVYAQTMAGQCSGAVSFSNLQKDVDAVTELMKQNVEKVVERGDQLKYLDTKSGCYFVD